MVPRVLILMSLLMLAMSISSMAIADDVFIYPNKGQSQEQLDKDKFECFQWAKQQTGFDPMAVPTASAPPPQQEAPKGGVGRGAVRGGVRPCFLGCSRF